MTLRTYTGGYLRFEGDHYREGKSPWSISTLWMAMYYKEIGQKNKAQECIDYIVNSANKFNSAIEYNNNGILTLKSVIESELLNCKGLKLITEFGQGYDTAEKAITGINSIAYIPFAQYIKANQADYDKNEYNGFSVEMRIMKFILRLNITSNLY